MSFCSPMTNSVRPPWAAAGVVKNTNPAASRTKTSTVARSPGERKSFSSIVFRSSPLEGPFRGKGEHAINRFFQDEKFGQPGAQNLAVLLGRRANRRANGARETKPQFQFVFDRFPLGSHLRFEEHAPCKRIPYVHEN